MRSIFTKPESTGPEYTDDAASYARQHVEGVSAVVWPPELLNMLPRVFTFVRPDEMAALAAQVQTEEDKELAGEYARSMFENGRDMSAEREVESMAGYQASLKIWQGVAQRGNVLVHSIRPLLPFNHMKVPEAIEDLKHGVPPQFHDLLTTHQLVSAAPRFHRDFMAHLGAWIAVTADDLHRAGNEAGLADLEAYVLGLLAVVHAYQDHGDRFNYVELQAKLQRATVAVKDQVLTNTMRHVAEHSAPAVGVQ